MKWKIKNMFQTTNRIYHGWTNCPSIPWFTCYAQDSNCGKSKPLANLFGHVLQQRQHCGKKSQGSPVSRQVNRFNSMQGCWMFLAGYVPSLGTDCFANFEWICVAVVSSMSFSHAQEKILKPWVTMGQRSSLFWGLYNGCSNPPKKDGSWLSDVIMKLHHPLQQSY